MDYRRIRVKITKEEFERLSKITSESTLNAEVNKYYSEADACGYGISKEGRPVQEDGEYFVVYYTYSSCD